MDTKKVSGGKRVIKFRAWDGKTMSYYGNPILENLDIGNKFIHGLFFANLGASTRVGTVNLMQFTGLLDKNSDELYESDIVQWTAKFRDTDIDTPPKRGQIKWNHEGCCWQINYEKGGIHYYKELRANVGGEAYAMTSIEKVGNIFENADLLNF